MKTQSSNLPDHDAQGVWKATNLKYSSTTGAGCIVPHGDVVCHHLSAGGDVDSTSILSYVAHHLDVGEGQLTDIVGGHTATLCPLIEAALGVVHVQRRPICTTYTAAFSVSAWHSGIQQEPL